MNSDTPRYLAKLSAELFTDLEERRQFCDAVIANDDRPVGLLWTKSKPAECPFTAEPALSWQPKFVDRVSRSERPGAHPLHHAGYYYCLDMSSVFAAAPLCFTDIPHPRVIDVCSAPGGKSVFAWRALDPHELICNEVIGKRHGALSSNIQRCGLDTAQISKADSKKLAQQFPEYFDIAIVDVPCSCQSLGLKQQEAWGAFHPMTIKRNAMRQRRIIANSLRLVRPKGFLLYSTCTFSRDENEAIIAWAIEHFPNFHPVPLAILNEFKTKLAPFDAYRLYPHSGIGAGAFTCLLQHVTT